MNKILTFDNSSIFIFEQMLEPLFTVTPDGTETEPLLAEGYKVSKDQKTYTIALKKGVTFSSGAGDDLRRREVLHRRGHQARATPVGASSTAAIETVTAKDKYTVVVELKYAVGADHRRPGPVLQRHRPEELRRQEHPRSSTRRRSAPAPYKWGEWKKGQYLKVDHEPRLLAEGEALPGQRRPGRWCPTPTPASCRCRAVRSTSTSTPTGRASSR